MQKRSLTLGISHGLDSKPEIWGGEGDFLDISSFEYVFVMENIEGDAIFTAIATAAAAAAFSAGIGGTILGIGTAALIGELVATIATVVLTAGVSLALNAIMKALSPSTQSKQHGSSSIFSQELNSDAEGNPVPWLIGETLGGGVIIGKVSTTYDVLDVQLTSSPSFPTDTPLIYKAYLSGITEGRWYKLLGP